MQARMQRCDETVGSVLTSSHRLQMIFSSSSPPSLPPHLSTSSSPSSPLMPG